MQALQTFQTLKKTLQTLRDLVGEVWLDIVSKIKFFRKYRVLIDNTMSDRSQLKARLKRAELEKSRTKVSIHVIWKSKQAVDIQAYVFTFGIREIISSDSGISVQDDLLYMYARLMSKQNKVLM